MTDTVTVIASAVTLIGAVATAYMLWRKSNAALSSSVISTYQTRVDQLEKAMDRMQIELDTLKKQMAKKDLYIDHMEKLLQGKNPELEEFIVRATEHITYAEGVLSQMEKKFNINSDEKNV